MTILEISCYGSNLVFNFGAWNVCWADAGGDARNINRTQVMGELLHDANDFGLLLYVIGALKDFKGNIDLVFFVLQRSCWCHNSDRSQGKMLETKMNE